MIVKAKAKAKEPIRWLPSWPWNRFGGESHTDVETAFRAEFGWENALHEWLVENETQSTFESRRFSFVLLVRVGAADAVPIRTDAALNYDLAPREK